MPGTTWAMLPGNVTLNGNLMLFGRLGWANAGAPIALRAMNAGLRWRPGFSDDLFGIGTAFADPADRTSDTQKTGGGH
ncbi:MAG: hypothetical protein R8G34_02530 [Paracoccaceae bacterium]|nr:hypothetical protein [Paracoccaceae bacterium]